MTTFLLIRAIWFAERFHSPFLLIRAIWFAERFHSATPDPVANQLLAFLIA